jgi:hypothetical protein
MFMLDPRDSQGNLVILRMPGVLGQEFFNGYERKGEVFVTVEKRQYLAPI